MIDAGTRSPETNHSLQKILDCFEQADPKSLGHIRSEVAAGLIREVLAHREAEAGTLESHATHPLEIAAEHFKVAFGKFTGELQAVIDGGAPPPAAIGALMRDVDRLVDMSLQLATEVGEVPAPPSPEPAREGSE